MSDQRTTHAAPERKAGRKIPPLVWIVVAMFVGWFVIAMLQRGGSDVTPQGGTHPQQAEGTSIMPAAPGSPTAPATPGGVANGPNQPPADAP